MGLRDHAALAVAMRGRARPAAARAFLDGLPATLVDAETRAFPTASHAVRVEEGGRSFTLPDRDPVDLSRRAAPSRILDALARHRVERPGEPLDVEALFGAGWPGERALPEARVNRVHVTLSQLRALGLADLLVTHVDGWLLDPDVPLVRTPRWRPPLSRP